MSFPFARSSTSSSIATRCSLRGRRTQHPNGIRFTASDVTGPPLFSATYFSIGGGFIIEDGADVNAAPLMTTSSLPYPFRSAAELLEMAKRDNRRIDQVMMRNECARRGDTPSRNAVRRDILRIWEVMQSCVARGLATDGILPGGLGCAAAQTARGAPAARTGRRQRHGRSAGPARLGHGLRHGGERGERRRRPRRHRAHQRSRRSHPRRRPLLPQLHRRRRRGGHPALLPHLGGHRHFSTRRTPRSPAPRSDARARSASPAPWPPAVSPPRSAARMRRWSTPRRSAWSTTSA